MSFFTRVVVLGAIASVPFLACGGGGLGIDAPLDGGEGGAGDGSLTPSGQGVGQPCDDTLKCRPGLACTAGKCEPGRSSEQGTPCVISAECKTGLYCGPERKCAPAGAGEDGASCASDAECKSGLRCNLVGLGAVCQPEGQGDVGGQCKLGGDCFGGLACVKNACTPLPPGQTPPLAIPSWQGVECKDDPGPVVAYFRVPRGTPEDGDFFRLPFPNDIRRAANGHPTLTGFPTPGSDLLGFDPVDRYVKDVEANADGFSAYPTVTLRFSGTPDFESIKVQGSVRWVDVTAGAGNDLGLAWSATSGRNAYVCNNSIGIRPRKGEALIPGHTYAVFITKNAKLPGGTPVERAADMTAMLGASAPAEAALQTAYNAYAPFRTWATSKAFDLQTVLTTAVFTVANTTTTATQLAAAVQTAPMPSATNWVRCGGGAASPCPDATGDRACPATPDPDFDELHALVSLPIFQKGTAPYLNPTDGGDIATTVQRTENVCMALMIPKGEAMPANGWPLVIYAHGTGGSFRSHISDGKALAAGTGGRRMAVLGIDQVQHGPRRGTSKDSPNNLFFNFTNPNAARGNPLQGAADQLALVRFAKNVNLAAAGDIPAIRFDRVSYWGHSQGATEGGIALAYTTQANVQGAVLSGSGASLIDALLSKTSPVNIAAAVPFVLADPKGVDTYHPVLSLLQNAIDPADPLNHARAIVSPPNAKHVFVPYGQKDTYTPSIVQQTFVLAAGLGLAQSPAGVTIEPIDGLTPVAVPAGANLQNSSITGYTRQYAPSGYDGHFVAQKNGDGNTNTIRFLSDLGAQTAPQFGR